MTVTYDTIEHLTVNAATSNELAITGSADYIVNPGAEEASWERFHAESIDKFINGEFAGDYQKMLLDEFDKYLPEQPPWPVD